jgi:hypothetical protein
MDLLKAVFSLKKSPKDLIEAVTRHETQYDDAVEQADAAPVDLAAEAASKRDKVC